MEGGKVGRGDKQARKGEKEEMEEEERERKGNAKDNLQ